MKNNNKKYLVLSLFRAIANDVNGNNVITIIINITNVTGVHNTHALTQGACIKYT